MKRQPRAKSKAPAQRGDGKVSRPFRSKRPTPGWKGHPVTAIGWRNPRVPSVPATLELNLDEYFTATALMGLIASQVQEPDPQWCCDWSFRMGKKMAAEARKRRRK